MQKHTVSTAFVRAAVAELPSEARARVLDKAEIPIELLETPGARVPAQSFSALWLAVARELDDEFFGLDSRRMKVGSFALLCHALLHCETIGSALRRCLRSFSVFLDDLDGELRLSRGVATISLNNRISPPERALFAAETFLIMVHGLMCWLAGQRIPLLRASFASPRPEHAEEYKAMFTNVLTFDAERTSISFDARALSAPVAQSEASLKRFLRSAPQSVFLKYKNEESWTARIRKRLRGSNGDEWPTLDELSTEFDIAPSTLRRRLEAEGTTFQAIKDTVRRDLAIQHLGQSKLSISEIADMLGFQDASAFHRAFKRWTGSQPGSYRDGGKG